MAKLLRQLDEIRFFAKAPNQLLVGPEQQSQVLLELGHTLRNGTQEKLFVGQQLHLPQSQLQRSIARRLVLQATQDEANRANALLHKQFIAQKDLQQVLHTQSAFVI